MSQRVKVLSAKVSGSAFLGFERLSGGVFGPGAPVWSSDPDRVMGWLCDGFRFRFNQYRAWRATYAKAPAAIDPTKASRVDPDIPAANGGVAGGRAIRENTTYVRVLDDAGEPILVPLGSNPETRLSNAEVRRRYPHLSAVPDLILQAPEKVEAQDWFAAVKRRQTLVADGGSGGGLPGMRRKDSDQRLVCWFSGGRNAVYRKVGRRTATVTITGSNPSAWRGKAGARWKVTLRVRHSQPIRPYTSVHINWTTKQLVFTNPPQVPAAKQSTGAVVGLDVGVAHTIATSDGEFFDQPDTADLHHKIAAVQRQMSRSQQVNNPTNNKNIRPSRRYQKLNAQLRLLNTRRNNRVTDWRHKITTHLVATHDLIVIESLAVKQMTKTAKGTPDKPGSKVAQKQGLNRSLARSAFGTLREMLTYKTAAAVADGHHQTLIAVNPANTSRRCNQCGHTAKENRESQAVFCCTMCGHLANADTNAALNVLDKALNTGADQHRAGKRSEPPRGFSQQWQDHQATLPANLPAHAH